MTQYMYISVYVHPEGKENAKHKWLTTCLIFRTQKSYFHTLKWIILIQTSRNLAFHCPKYVFIIKQKQRQHNFGVVLRSVTTFIMMAMGPHLQLWKRLAAKPILILFFLLNKEASILLQVAIWPVKRVLFTAYIAARHGI